MTNVAPILTMTGIHKGFVGVKALDDVDFRLLPGEVHALLGENGAGKSTLIKVLTGVFEIDRGAIELKGKPVLFANPLEAQHAGVTALYQEVNLCPNLSVAENIYIGREPRRRGRIQWRAVRQQAAEVLERVDVHVDVSAQLSTYSIAVQQMVAIARAIDISADVLILDEPTSSLDQGEVEQLFKVIRQLTAQGIAVVFVSHFLEQVYEIADRMTVLRNGRLVGEWATSELTRVELVSKMLGREYKTLEALEKKSRVAQDALEASTPVLEAQAVGRKGVISPFDVSLHRGEIVGLAGLLGSGRTEIARLLFGADRSDSGHVLVDGKAVIFRNPRAATTNGIAFCPENRRTEGLIEDLTVRENIILALQAERGWTRPIPRKRQDELVDKWIKALDIRTTSAEQPVRTLSGG
ncbi:MAG TPA: sugar ABC transporter ATP-binding protein, partial [Gaiellaceae bacterium]